MATKTKPAPQKKEKEEAPEKETPETPTPDGPLLDLSDAAVKKMIKLAKKRGWVSHEQINAVLPSEEVTSDQIEDVFAMLNEMGINVVEQEETEEAAEADGAADEPADDGDGELVERCCDAASRFAERIVEVEGAEVVNEVVLNQVLVRFESDECTDAIVERIQSAGRIWLGGTTWRGWRAIRVSVSNWQTGDEEIDLAVEAFRQAAGQSPAR